MVKSEFLVFIPAFNEEKNLKGIITQLKKFFSNNQIILLNDGSTDNTTKIARQLGIRIIKNNENRGKGQILRSSFEVIIEKFPKKKWIITIDADGQHDCNDIPYFIKMAEENPNLGIIIGKRNYHRMPMKNRLSNTLTSNWCNYWLKWGINDIQCGFRCYNTEMLRHIMDIGLKKNKFDLETEILLIGWFLKFKMTEIPINTIYIKNHRKTRIVPSIDVFRWMLLVIQFGFSPEFVRKVWYQRNTIL